MGARPLARGVRRGHGRGVISPELLRLLCCPETHQPLRMATPEELAAMQPRPEDALVRGDGLVAYPIRDGFPLLLPAAALPLAAKDGPHG